MDENKLLNWSQISELLTGNRTQITANYNGKKYREDIKLLRFLVRSWINRVK